MHVHMHDVGLDHTRSTQRRSRPFPTWHQLVHLHRSKPSDLRKCTESRPAHVRHRCLFEPTDQAATEAAKDKSPSQPVKADPGYTDTSRTGVTRIRARPTRTPAACSTPAPPSRWPATATPGSRYSSSMPLCIALAVREMHMSAAEVLWSATAGGAASLRRDDIGRVAVSARADLAVLLSPPGLPPRRTLHHPNLASRPPL